MKSNASLHHGQFLAAASARLEPAIDNPAIDMQGSACRPKQPVRARAGGSPKAISFV